MAQRKAVGDNMSLEVVLALAGHVAAKPLLNPKTFAFSSKSFYCSTRRKKAVNPDKAYAYGFWIYLGRMKAYGRGGSSGRR